MSKTARFEKWVKDEGFGLDLKRVHEDRYFWNEPANCFLAWQAALQSLEVTPSLVELARSVRRDGRPMEDVLTAVFNAIKEQAK